MYEGRAHGGNPGPPVVCRFLCALSRGLFIVCLHCVVVASKHNESIGENGKSVDK